MNPVRFAVAAACLAVLLCGCGVGRSAPPASSSTPARVSPLPTPTPMSRVRATHCGPASYAQAKRALETLQQRYSERDGVHAFGITRIGRGFVVRLLISPGAQPPRCVRNVPVRFGFGGPIKGR
ncbi:hypothetical protein [Sciscionella sediminilitoris]|uniref:hypothetical protein n=1 Tax=Sciscionella sediminilitoris TaxID=1445613 RepID=UPI0012E12BF2|nr:hypothetical protein [Sciscionella sp. SE31]